MNQQAIVHTESITRKGELKYFQISLPGTAKKIIAVEASIFLLTSGLNENSVAPIVAGSGSSGNEGSGGGGGGSNNCPNPGTASIEAVSNNVAGSVRTQVFRIGAAVNPGFIYSCGVYSVVISVTAVDGDTPATIATKLAQAVHNTSLATWNQYGSNNQNYKPTGSASSDLMTLTTDNQHSFFASGSGSCGGGEPPPPPPPPPPTPIYDPLFTIAGNSRAGILTLQSPDATDIFLQTEVYRDDVNIGYADFTNHVLVVSEWTKGKKRYATEVFAPTHTPILEAYYKDLLGVQYNENVQYQLNIFIWIENMRQ